MNALNQSQTIKQQKVDQAIEEVQRAKQQEESSKDLLKSTSDRLRIEYATFVKNRDQDMMEQLLSYAKKQLLLQQNLLQHLEAIQKV